MPTIPVQLQYAKTLSKIVNDAFADGSFADSVSSTTADLLEHWFGDEACEFRSINFHSGQRQAILNTIYLHEIIGSQSVLDNYDKIGMGEMCNDLNLIQAKTKQLEYNHPKYCIKMATGTGKTFVLNALLIWQYLNHLADPTNPKYSSNFLIVAPGNIVYDRLLDSFLGKEIAAGDSYQRDFSKSDIYGCRDLFVPKNKWNLVSGFVQNSVLRKEDIGVRSTGNGLIAITNWQGLRSDNEEVRTTGVMDYKQMIKDILPLKPGTGGGNTLSVLDNNLGNTRLEFLKNLNNLVVFNDEAHHIWNDDLKWQESLNLIADNKGAGFVQLDFSATPYSYKGKKQLYFDHIVVDFELKTAIHQGLVKMVAMEKRQDFARLETLDFKSVRDNGKIVSLSEGQKIMLTTGYHKLEILTKSFAHLGKYPKMMVMCEETDAVDLVAIYLLDQGFKSEEILVIHSNKKGEISESEWKSLKYELFNLDRPESKVKIVVSVLMLREGFDVNSICVIVPLRSTESGILLEQTIGRGLRLMWREEEYQETKLEMRQDLLVHKNPPKSYLDMVSIVEHPKFIEFYESQISTDDIFVETRDLENQKILGDIIVENLKDNYRDFDIAFPIVKYEPDQILPDDITPFSKELKPLSPTLINTVFNLKKANEKHTFVSSEATVGTNIDKYSFANISFHIKADGYNEFLSAMINRILNFGTKTTERKAKYMPLLHNKSKLARILDNYIRTRVFDKDFDPNDGDNYAVLSSDIVCSHILGQFNTMILNYAQNVEFDGEWEFGLVNLSTVNSIKIRENYSVSVSKSIFNKLGYPSNKGEFEKDFMLFVDNDLDTQSFIKIVPRDYEFLRFEYIKSSGSVGNYYPDFVIKLRSGKIWLIETKADNQKSQEDVIRKERAVVSKIQNHLNNIPLGKDHLKEVGQFGYAIITDQTFYNYTTNNATLVDLLEYSWSNIDNNSTEDGELF